MSEINGEQQVAPTTETPISTETHTDALAANNKDGKQVFTNIIREMGMGMFSMQSGIKGMDAFAALDKEQKDKVIDAMLRADEREHEYNCKALEKEHETEGKKIEAGKYSQGTQRQILTIAIVGVLLITAIIIFAKPEYLTNWLSFIAGISGGGLGGYGLAKAQNKAKPENAEDTD